MPESSDPGTVITVDAIVDVDGQVIARCSGVSGLFAEPFTVDLPFSALGGPPAPGLRYVIKPLIDGRATVVWKPGDGPPPWVSEGGSGDWL